MTDFTRVSTEHGVVDPSPPMPLQYHATSELTLADSSESLMATGSSQAPKVMTFGKVKLARHVVTHDMVAIKSIQKKNVKTTKQMNSVQREVRIMKLLKHEHIVEVLETLETPDNIYIVMEYASGGELFDYIVANFKTSEQTARHFFRQIVSAMDYCHQNSIIHRDLKPENLLLDKNGDIKIIDFGFGNTFHRDRTLDTYCGSPFYAAPEMVKGTPYTGPEVDIWSMGVILYAMLNGRLPFDSKDMSMLYLLISKGDYAPMQVSPAAENLIQIMLTVNPGQRAKMADVINHIWVNIGYTHKVDSQVRRRPSVVPEPDVEAIAELVTYGISEREIKRLLSLDCGLHPIKSLYFLVYDHLERQRVHQTQLLFHPHHHHRLNQHKHHHAHSLVSHPVSSSPCSSSSAVQQQQHASYPVTAPKPIQLRTTGPQQPPPPTSNGLAYPLQASAQTHNHSHLPAPFNHRTSSSPAVYHHHSGTAPAAAAAALLPANIVPSIVSPSAVVDENGKAAVMLIPQMAIPSSYQTQQQQQTTPPPPPHYPESSRLTGFDNFIHAIPQPVAPAQTMECESLASSVETRRNALDLTRDSLASFESPPVHATSTGMASWFWKKQPRTSQASTNNSTTPTATATAAAAANVRYSIPPVHLHHQGQDIQVMVEESKSEAAGADAMMMAAANSTGTEPNIRMIEGSSTRNSVGRGGGGDDMVWPMKWTSNKREGARSKTVSSQNSRATSRRSSEVVDQSPMIQASTHTNPVVAPTPKERIMNFFSAKRK